MSKILLGGVEFDVIDEEVIEFSNEVTESPVEEGADIVDHAKNRPITLPLPGRIGDDDPELAREKFEQLREYAEERELLTYVSEYVVLEDVIIQEFVPRRDAQTGYGFVFDLVLRQVEIATREYADYLDPEAIPEVKEEEEAGRVQTEEEPTDDLGKSSLLRIIESIEEAFGLDDAAEQLEEVEE